MLPVVTQADPFTSFIPAVRLRFAQRLAACLGVPDGRPVSLAQAHGGRDGSFRACVRVDGGPRPVFVELSSAGPDVQGWYRGKRWVLGYWQTPESGDPFAEPTSAALLQAVRRVVEGLDAAPEDAPELVELRATLKDFQGFSALRDRHFRYAAPREAMVRLGFRCNQKCDFCWQGRDWPEPPAELYHQWVDEIAGTGVRVLHFSGGEPTIHPELPALVARAKSHGMEVWLQTNAIRLAKPRFADELVSAGLRGIFVSYHSHLDEVSDRMTVAPGTHRVTELGILASLERGLLVVLNVVVDARNVSGLAEQATHIVERFARPFPASRVSLSYSHPGPSIDPAQYDRELVPLDEVAPRLVAALRVLKAAGVPATTGGTCGFPPCTFAEAPEFASFDAPGTYSRADAPDRKYAPACDTCAVRDRCIGFRAPYVARHGFRGVRPFAHVPDGAGVQGAPHGDWDHAELSP